MMDERPPVRIGVIGTGFIARHFVKEVLKRPAYVLGRVLTRRLSSVRKNFPCSEALVTSLDALIESSDVILECTGDAQYAAETVGVILDAGKPVVTLNSEFHATVGSYYVNRGLLSEAEGDQPGCLASLYEDARAMGFAPLVCANMKAFLNRNPSVEDMKHWARRQGYSLEMVTSFTDGTKIQIEQCLVANGLGLDIAQEGMIGLPVVDLKVAAADLGAIAERHGRPISDYILDRSVPHGVFIVASHDDYQSVPLANFKMGDGPYYVLVRSYCLGHLEVFKTVERLLDKGRPLLNNSATPTISVASVAKRDLKPGERIVRGCGSFELRGECVRIRDRPDHLPICLANNIQVRRHVKCGDILNMEDVSLPESAALIAWDEIRSQRTLPRVGGKQVVFE